MILCTRTIANIRVRSHKYLFCDMTAEKVIFGRGNDESIGRKLRCLMFCFLSGL